MKRPGVLAPVLPALMLASLLGWLLPGCAAVRPTATADAAGCSPSAETHRGIVLAFYTEALVQRHVRAAFERHASPDFIEHKTSVPEGTRSATIDYLEDLIQQAPDPQWRVVRTIAEGDLVFLHARFVPQPGAPEFAIGDVFRLRHCQLVEHWDIIGPPVKAPRNPNSRF